MKHAELLVLIKSKRINTLVNFNFSLVICMTLIEFQLHFGDGGGEVKFPSPDGIRRFSSCYIHS